MSFIKKISDFFNDEEPANSEKRKHSVTVRKRYDKLPISKGNYSKEHLKIKATIRQIFKEYDFNTCYIGATENLDSRWSKYSDWALKHVLYETTSFKFIKEVEEDLIKYVSNKKLSCNRDHRSVGLKDGAEKYYIYILADKGCKKRS